MAIRMQHVPFRCGCPLSSLSSTQSCDLQSSQHGVCDFPRPVTDKHFSPPHTSSGRTPAGGRWSATRG